LKNGEVDIVAALRASPAFANPRLATVDTAAKPGVVPPFDVTADSIKRSHP
jgi:hypothetical protein